MYERRETLPGYPRSLDAEREVPAVDESECEEAVVLCKVLVEVLRVCWKHAIVDQFKAIPDRLTGSFQGPSPRFRLSLRLPFQTLSKHGSAGGGVSNERRHASDMEARKPWSRGPAKHGGQTWFWMFHGSNLCESTSPLAASRVLFTPGDHFDNCRRSDPIAAEAAAWKNGQKKAVSVSLGPGCRFVGGN